MYLEKDHRSDQPNSGLINSNESTGADLRDAHCDSAFTLGGSVLSKYFSIRTRPEEFPLNYPTGDI